jgi:hypothetical protein
MVGVGFNIRCNLPACPCPNVQGRLPRRILDEGTLGSKAFQAQAIVSYNVFVTRSA